MQPEASRANTPSPSISTSGDFLSSPEISNASSSEVMVRRLMVRGGRVAFLLKRPNLARRYGTQTRQPGLFAPLEGADDPIADTIQLIGGGRLFRLPTGNFFGYIRLLHLGAH